MVKHSNFKKVTSFITTFLMIFSILFSNAPFVFASEKNTETLTLQLLATSDTHGKFMPFDYSFNGKDDSGSLAQISTSVKDLRKQNPNTILVDAGDIIQGNSQEIFLNEKNPMILGMNYMNYDTITLGNHEFNYGVTKLNTIISKANATILCGNVYNKDGSLIGQPYKIVEKAGVKVGIIGMTNPNIVKWDGPNLKDYKVTSPIVETKKVINEIKDKVDIMIAVNHTSDGSEYIDEDSAENLAKACPELSVIVGAHEHKGVPKKVLSNNILFVENKSGAASLSKVDIKLTKKDGKYVLADKSKDLSSDLIYMKDSKTKESIKPDSEFEKFVKPQHDEAIKDANTVIGELKGGPLAKADEIKGISTAQVEDTAMIDLINAVQLHYSKADVSAAASFSNKANMQPGTIKKCDVSLIYRFANTLYLTEVTGKQLKKYMEWSANYYNTFKPSDLTVSFNEKVRNYNYDMFSGVKYDVDISKEPGNRIVNLTKMDGTPIKDNDKLKLSVNNYRFNSQFGENGIFKGEELPKLIEKEVCNGASISELIQDYIKNVKKGAITPEVDNNWKIIGANFDKKDNAIAAALVNQDLIKLPESADGRTQNVKSLTKQDIAGYNLVTVAHTNDTHSRVSEGKYDGMGFGRVATQVNNLRENNKNVLLLDAGDALHGLPIATLSKGESIVKIFNAMGYDAMTAGNHDFDYGQERLVELSKITKFPILSANTIKKDGTSLLKPYTIKEIDGIKFGIFGLSTPETKYTSHPKNVQGLTFEDPVKVGNQMVKELEGKCDVIVAIGHLGNVGDYSSDKIAAKVKGIDLLVDGHSHTELPQGTLVGKTLIVQTGEYDKNLGQVNLLFKDGKLVSKKANLFSKNEGMKLEQNKDVEEIISNIQKEQDKVLSVVIGKTAVTLDGERENLRTKGTNLGDLVANCMLEASKADLTITNGGGIRASIQKGEITKGNVVAVSPFGNSLILKECKGSDILAALEHGVSVYPKQNGGFPQVAGVTLKFDPKQPKGKKVFDVKIGGKPLDLNKTYKLATNDFMSVGGDGYTMLAKGKVITLYSSLEEILADYITKQGTINIKVQNRVQVAAKPAQPKPEKPKPEKPKQIIYTVVRGDNLYKISKKFKVDYREIVKANKIKNPNLIYPGQKFIIPKGKTRYVATATEEIIPAQVYTNVMMDSLGFTDHINIHG